MRITLFAKSISSERISHVTDGTRCNVTRLRVMCEDDFQVEITVHAPSDAAEPLKVLLLPDRLAQAEFAARLNAETVHRMAQAQAEPAAAEQESMGVTLDTRDHETC